MSFGVADSVVSIVRHLDVCLDRVIGSCAIDVRLSTASRESRRIEVGQSLCADAHRVDAVGLVKVVAHLVGDLDTLLWAVVGFLVRLDGSGFHPLPGRYGDGMVGKFSDGGKDGKGEAGGKLHCEDRKQV